MDTTVQSAPIRGMCDVREDYVLPMIPVDLRVLGRPEMQTAAARVRRAGKGGTVHCG